MSAYINILEELDLDIGTISINDEGAVKSVLKNQLIQQVKKDKFWIDKVYFSGDFPSIYYKSVKQFDTAVLDNISKVHKQIWNQGKVPFLYIESDTEVRIYNCYEKPVEFNKENKDLKNIELFKTKKSAEKGLTELKNVFGKISIETGQFWKEQKYAEKLLQQSRVDRVLISNLKTTRKKLQALNLPIHIIHDLLLRSLFLLYLEDREATDKAFYQEYAKGATSFFDVLDNIEATYDLFKKLESAFNGNLSPVTTEEKQLVNIEHLQVIKKCFWDKIDESNQAKMFRWRTFDFSVISIELLSEIYEEFLAEIDKDDKKKKGAYYTPHILVNFILNKVLPYSDASEQNYHIKILDPTCGSGIFLVESFKRLLDRWQKSNPNQSPTFEIIKDLVLNNIFGIEINRSAIKVAAFSLYLAILDALNPKTLWKNKKFPYLIYEPNETDEEKQGRNLFRMSSLGSGDFEKIDFDLIVGNPPFKRGDLNKEATDYLNKYDFAQEYVLAFLHRATTLCPNGKIALVSASKILFNTSSKYQNFRQFLFNDTYVEEVYNFSILRNVKKSHGKNLFASAIGPASVLFYKKNIPQNAANEIKYVAPKTAIKNNIIDGIAIDKVDVKYLPREECQKPDTKIWKVAMWGNDRDWRFINGLIDGKKLSDYFKDNIKTGLHRPNDDKCYVEYLKDYPLIQTNKIERYYTKVSHFDKLGLANYRKIDENIFEPPFIVIKEGLKNKRFCASSITEKAVFLNAVYGIRSNNSDELQFIVNYINSIFATYYLFLTTSTWGVERERVKVNELLLLPYKNVDDDILQYSTDFLNKIIEIKETFLLEKEQKIKTIENDINELIYKYLSINPIQKIQIEDVVNFNLLLDGENSIAFKPTTQPEITQYAQMLCEELNNFLEFGATIRVNARTFTISTRNALNVVALDFTTNNQQNEAIHSDESINKLLKEIEKYTYEKYSESVYFRKFVKYRTENTLFIVKPNEKRFWSRSMALNDADEVVVELMK